MPITGTTVIYEMRWKMPVGGATNGVGGVQQNTNTQNIQQQPAKGKWGSRKVSSFSPKTVFIANTPKSAAEAPKKLGDFNITAKDPKVYCQKTDDGLYYTFNPNQGKKASRGFLKQQVRILVEKGYSKEEANRFIKDLSKASGKHETVIKDVVAKKEFADSKRQELVEKAESSFIQKGYLPGDAKKRAFNLVAKPGTGSKWVDQQIKYTHEGPAKKAADILKEKGYTSEDSYQILDHLEQHFKGNMKKIDASIQNITPKSELLKTGFVNSKTSDGGIPKD